MKKRLLVIDDESEIRSVISQMVRHRYDVFEANDGIEALDILKHEPIDIVLTDFYMPNMNGLEFVKSLRESNLNLPVVVLTGKGHKELHTRFLASYTFEYLNKPFHVDELIKTLDKGLNSDGLCAPESFSAAYYDQFKINLSKESAEWLQKLSLSRGLSVSSCMEEIIRQYKFESEN